MKIKISKVCCVGIASMALTGVACAAPHYASSTCPSAVSKLYVGLNVGFSLPRGQISVSGSNSDSVDSSDIFDNGYNFGGVLGYKLTGNLPLSFEFAVNHYSYAASSDSNSGDVSAHAKILTLMGNVLYNWNIGNGVSPYAGIGLGYTQAALDLTANDDDVELLGSGLGYQGIVGVHYNVNKYMDIGLSYHLMGTTAKINLDKDDAFKLSGAMFHSFNFSVNYHFS